MMSWIRRMFRSAAKPMSTLECKQRACNHPRHTNSSRQSAWTCLHCGVHGSWDRADEQYYGRDFRNAAEKEFCDLHGL